MTEPVVIRTAANRSARLGPQTAFTGQVLQDPMETATAPAFLGVTMVTFVPGARTRWHTHEDRQVLVVETGVGMLQVKGGPAQLLQPGDVAVIPPGVVHWHGSTTASVFRHVSILHGTPESTRWLEPVDEDEYRVVADLARAR